MKYLLWGDKELKESFYFLFSDVLQEDCISAPSFCPIDLMLDDSTDGYQIIVCAYDAKKVSTCLEEKGLIYDKHYRFAHDFFEYFNFDLKNHTKGRDILVVGRLKYSKSIERQDDVKVQNSISPVKIDHLSRSREYYIIAGSLYYKFKKVAKKYGLVEYDDYVSETFLKYSSCEKILNKVFYSQRKYDFVCNRPFEMISVAPVCYVCCGGRMPFAIGNLNEQSWESIWKSNRRKIACLSILNGSYVLCNEKYCPYLSVSKEDAESKVQKSAIDVIYNFDHLSFHLIPRRVLLEYDRSCNLSCPSCRKKYMRLSSFEEKVANRITEIIMKDIMPYVEQVECAGYGEALFSKQYMRILSSPLTKTKRLHLLSNGLLLTPDIWNRLLKEYQSVQIEISVDAASADVYKIVRGGNFELLLKNLKFLGDLRKTNLLSKYIINMTISQKNVEDIAAFVRLGKQIHADQVKLSAIHNWHWDNYEFKEYTIFDDEGNIQKELLPYFTCEELQDDIVYDNNIGFLYLGEK